MAPAGNYYELQIGGITVLDNPSDIYTYKRFDYVYSIGPDNSIDKIPSFANNQETIQIVNPQIGTFYFLSFGYVLRNKLPIGRNLFYDIGASISFGVGRPESIERRAGGMIYGHHVSVDASSDSVEEYIRAVSYNYIVKQNLFKIKTESRIPDLKNNEKFICTILLFVCPFLWFYPLAPIQHTSRKI